MADVRNRALAVLGMANALRRSGLVALTVVDLEWILDGMRVRVLRGKIDQEGRGAVIAVPDDRQLTPMAHLAAWLGRTAVTEEPVFRTLANRCVGRMPTGRSVSLIVKRRAAAGYTAYGLRAGFLTSAAIGASIWKMREVSRRKSVHVLNGCTRDSD